MLLYRERRCQVVVCSKPNPKALILHIMFRSVLSLGTKYVALLGRRPSEVLVSEQRVWNHFYTCSTFPEAPWMSDGHMDHSPKFDH